MQEVARPCHALHVARLEQQYAGHGIVVQPVLQRGFVGAQERPASAAAITTPVKSPERRAKGMVIHAHLREHVLPIQCGEGNQRVFWLAVNAVQRYLTDLASYNHAFSAELTPKGVVSESLEYICKTGRICDELKDGDHVWIDVGDGTPLSRVNSRPFGSQKILDDDEVEEEIEWVESSDHNDARRVMRYSRSFGARRHSRLSFVDWKAAGRAGLPVPEDEVDDAAGQLFAAFQSAWRAMDLSDLPGFEVVGTECKALLFKHFEKLCWIFSSYAAKSNAVQVLSLSEFWAFCKDIDAPTVHLNLTRATLLFTAIDTKYKDDPYNPRRGFNLHEFLEGVVRMSVLRQGNPSNAAVPLPECLENFLLHNVLKDTEGFQASQQTRLQLAAKPCRDIYARHEKSLRTIFRHFALRNKKHPGVLDLSDWCKMFRLSGLQDQSLTMSTIKKAFMFAQLGDCNLSEEEGAELDSLETLIFPEFAEALGRVALSQFYEDEEVDDAEKLNELLTLLVASQVGDETGVRVKERPPPGLWQRRQGTARHVAHRAA